VYDRDRTIVHLLPTGVEGPVTLRDGTAVFVRAAQPWDAAAVAAFAAGLSPDALELRFFSAARPEAVSHEALLEGAVGDRLSLLALHEKPIGMEVVGHGEYVRTAPHRASAEVAFLVADRFRHRGLATVLLHRLARAARLFGIREFEAEVLPENADMLDVFRRSGFPERVESASGGTHVRFSITEEPTPIPEA